MLENPSPPGTPPRGLVNAGSTLQIPPSPTRYLAFLARTSEGRYQPLSGHTFPTTSLLRLSAKTIKGPVDVRQPHPRTDFRDKYG